jgi:hypothetical protein
MKNNKLIRLMVAFILFVGILYLYRTQDMPLKSDLEMREDLAIGEVLSKRNSMLSPLYIKASMYPAEIKRVGDFWATRYFSNPTTHLMTQFYAELSFKIPGKPKFSSDEFMEATEYRWDKATTPYAKEYSLFFFEMMYHVSGNEDYLARLILESEDLISHLSSLSSLKESLAFSKYIMVFPLLRLINYRNSLVETPVISEEVILDFYAELKDFVNKLDNPVNERCRLVWSMAPLLDKSDHAKELYRSEVERAYDDFIQAVKGDHSQIKDLGEVSSCLLGFHDLDGMYEKINFKNAMDTSYEHYIRDTLNYPAKKECPSPGGFFNKPLKGDSCIYRKLYFSHNVFITYLLYRYDQLYS